MMTYGSEIVIPARGVRSLAWVGNSLMDVVGGNVRCGVDGSSNNPSIRWAFGFDGVATLSGSEYSVIYKRLGTKALLLKRDSILRELNRSFYHADVYEYPVCLARHGGRTLLIHCPEDYNRLEIEDAETGERLTARSSKSADFFHSRLAVNPSGTRLLSAGWVWQPWDAVNYFDLDAALRDPSVLDSFDRRAATYRNSSLVEESSACWQDDSRAIVTGGDEGGDDEESAAIDQERKLRRRGVVVYDTSTHSVLSSVVLEQVAGTIMPVGETHVVAFYHHPRLIRLSDGHVEYEWPSIDSGLQTSSIVEQIPPPPPMAFDPARRRFAIAQDDGIHVIELAETHA